jgi:glycosyltransferase involved in cell wall biosynthesis
MSVESLSFCSYINDKCIESSQPIHKYNTFRLPINYENFNVLTTANNFTIFVGSYNPKDERKGNNHFILCLFELVSLMQENVDTGHITLLYPSNIDVQLPNINNITVKSYEYAQTDAEMAKIYNMANVFVNNSMDDFGPVTLLHSLFCGVPVVSHEHGYASSFVENGFNGYVVDTNNYRAFAEAIYSIYKGELKHGPESIRDNALRAHLKLSSVGDVLFRNSI